MTPEIAIDVCRKAIVVILSVSAPMLLAGMVIGLMVSIFQAATQINEQTLSFIPKIVAVLVTMLLFGPWIIRMLSTFSVAIFASIATM
ncbi:MAG: flagellar biosynthesis protein FliQ [Desulfobulbaceae bacterium]|jgi:flagellar biosynthetic protein FliQ|nr:flagellar biosynthesis protein FliQ [Desulfobulbaceae bacterium]